jgi:signal transduction histidine kinase
MAALAPSDRDRLLAAVLAAIAVAQALVAPIASLPVGLTIALLTTVPVAWRRSAPVVAALLTTAAGLIPSDGYVYVGYVVAFVVFYSLAAHVDDVRAVVATVAGGVGLAIGASLVHGAVFGEYFGALSAVVGPAVVGRVVRHQRRQAERLRELTALLEAERDRGARSAVADERARIAREMHDVVAHGLSVIAIQSDAAQAALDHDARLARGPLATIRATATESLAEMRKLLGVLRAADDDADHAPQPGLSQLPMLLARNREAGLDVALEERGEPRPLAASIDVSAYRILQESLTNVRRHAPGARARVLVAYEPGRLRLEVADDGPGAVASDGGGHGIVGMRERARLHGGTLETAGDGGGFVVRAALPTEAHA